MRVVRFPLPFVFTLFLLIALVSVRLPATMPTASDADILKILTERIDVQKQGVGMVVGIVDGGGSRTIAYGLTEAGGTDRVRPDTIFEIGSATKVFTSLLLADAAERGEVALTDRVSRYLPSTVAVPERNGRSITLIDLATHTSGLPRLPGNMSPKNPLNPYADYTAEQLYAFLSSCTLTRDIGSAYEYSNLGAGLLGHVLERRAGTDYETLMRARIAGPLGMNDTVVSLTGSQRTRLAAGHNAEGAPVPNWDLGVLAGAGAIRSTAPDMLRLLSVALGYTRSVLTPAMASMLNTRRPTPTSGLAIALGWHILTSPSGGEVVWHNGGTGGYRSYIGVNPKSRIGVVVLSNMSTTAGVDDIGRHLLDPSFPLLQLSAPRKEIVLAPEVLGRYVGRYQLAPTFIMTVSREGGGLFVQATGQPRLEMAAVSEHEFVLRGVDAQISFEVEGARVVRLILHQNGAHQRATRID